MQSMGLYLHNDGATLPFTYKGQTGRYKNGKWEEHVQAAEIGRINFIGAV